MAGAFDPLSPAASTDVTGVTDVTAASTDAASASASVTSVSGFAAASSAASAGVPFPLAVDGGDRGRRLKGRPGGMVQGSALFWGINKIRPVCRLDQY